MKQYRQNCVIGNGSTAIVEKWEHNNIWEHNINGQPIVAIKRFKSNAKYEDFAKEVETLTSIKTHENIVSLLGICKLPSIIERNTLESCMVFEYVPCNLYQRLEKISSCRSEIKSDDWYKKVVSFTRQLVTGLKHLHDSNVLHRDIKPDNLLLTDSDTLKICDLGMSCALTDAEAGRCGVYVCSRPYRAPERLEHAQNLEVKFVRDMDNAKDDHDSTQAQEQTNYICSANKGFQEYSYPIDVWAVGCIVFEMLT
eukprot:jgi/Botrbrau1/20753/Bobra.0058s0081.1